MKSNFCRSIGYSNSDSWGPTLEKVFAEGQPPVLITEYTSREISKDLDLIRSRFPKAQTKLGPKENPFASIKPSLNIISDDEIPVIFRNFYSMVVLP